MTKQLTPKVNTLKVLERCIEDGTDIGYRRAHKHNSAPSESELKLAIVNSILVEIHE